MKETHALFQKENHDLDMTLMWHWCCSYTNINGTSPKVQKHNRTTCLYFFQYMDKVQTSVKTVHKQVNRINCVVLMLNIKFCAFLRRHFALKLSHFFSHINKSGIKWKRSTYYKYFPKCNIAPCNIFLQKANLGVVTMLISIFKKTFIWDKYKFLHSYPIWFYYFI